MRAALPFVLLLAAACGGKDNPPGDSGGTVELGVMRNCQPAEGRICPWAGAGYYGWNGDGLDPLDTWFSFPMSATHSPYGAIVIADWNNHKLRKLENGTFTTIMGTDFLGDGDPAKADSTPAGADGLAVALNHPTQQDYYSDGTLVSASWHTHKVRTWDPSTGIVHVVLGGAPGFDSDSGPISEMKLNQVKEVLVTSDDNLYVLDMRNERVRYVDNVSGMHHTIAGNGTQDYCGDGGPAVDACLNFPKNANPEPGGAIALDEAGGLLYIADTMNNIIRVVDLQTGIIDLVAGTPGVAGDVDGAGAQAQFSWPSDLVLDGSTLFVADANNHKIRAIDLTTNTVSTFVGTGEASCPIPEGALATPQICDNQHDGGDGGPAIEATLYRPFGLDLDFDGNLIIADSYNQRFRIVYR